MWPGCRRASMDDDTKCIRDIRGRYVCRVCGEPMLLGDLVVTPHRCHLRCYGVSRPETERSPPTPSNPPLARRHRSMHPNDPARQVLGQLTRSTFDRASDTFRERHGASRRSFQSNPPNSPDPQQARARKGNGRDYFLCALRDLCVFIPFGTGDCPGFLPPGSPTQRASA